MQPKSKISGKEAAYPYNASHSSVPAEPWWSIMGYNSVSAAMRRGSASETSSQEQSTDGQSHSGSKENDEDDDATRLCQSTVNQPLDGGYTQNGSGFSCFPSTMMPRGDGSIPQSTQFEVVGHSIACDSNPYPGPYFGGMVPPFGQPMISVEQIHPQLLHTRMPLNLDVAQEPVYVNAKQYQGILRRRESRAKAELAKKLIKNRKPYLHESRHQHALRRARSSGGRFAKKSDIEASNKSGSSTDKSASPGSLPSPYAGISNINGSFGRQVSFQVDMNGREEILGMGRLSQSLPTTSKWGN